MLVYFRCLAISVLCLHALQATAQCDSWEKLMYYDHVSLGSVARDPFDNIYITGTYHLEDFDLGPYHFELPASGNGAAFMAKFDKNHSLVWATTHPTDRSWTTRIALDADYNIIVTGSYHTFIDFGCVRLTNNGRFDGFVAKYTNDGDFIWATAVTNADDAEVEELAIGPNGNIIISGKFVERSAVTPGLPAADIAVGGMPVITGATNQVDAGYDSYVAAIRPDGQVLWTRGIGGEGNQYDYITDMTVDTHNNVVFTGFFSSLQIKVDALVLNRDNISQTLMVVKLDPAGKALWATTSQGAGADGGWGIATDLNDNVYVAGRFAWGPVIFGAVTLTPTGGATDTDAFVAKYTPAGVPVTARKFGNTDFDSADDVAVDLLGRVVITGYYYSKTIALGAFTSSKTNESADTYVATLTNDLATVECANFITGDGDAFFSYLSIDAGNNVWITSMLDGILNGTHFNYGDEQFTSTEVWGAIAVIGSTPSPHTGTMPPPPHTPVTFSLGPDITACPDTKTLLTPGAVCQAHYLWSTGETTPAIEVTKAGTYWVDVTFGGTTTRDEIVVAIEPPITVTLSDQTICPGGTATWVAPVYAGATYLWNDGSTSSSKTASTAGSYWVHIANACEEVGDTVVLSIKANPLVELGPDKVLCAGKVLALAYTPAAGEMLTWSDGSTGNTLAITREGTYNITVSNGCTSATDQVAVSVVPLPIVDLGADRQLCNGSDVALVYTPRNGETLQWSTGATSAELPVTQPGVYSLSVTNQCGTASDEVAVTVKDIPDLALPNIITHNGDNKNEHFMLPDAAQGSSLTLYNRWGMPVYQSTHYTNDWPQQAVATGTYFYVVQGICIGRRKGSLYVKE